MSNEGICRQPSKIKISCYKREKTPKYREKQAKKRICPKITHQRMLGEFQLSLIILGLFGTQSLRKRLKRRSS